MFSKLKLQPNGFIYLEHWTSKKVPVKTTTNIRIPPGEWISNYEGLKNPKLKDANGKSFLSQLKQHEGAFLSAIDDYKAGRTTDIKKTYLEKMNLSVASGGVKAPVKFLEYYNARLSEFKADKKKNFKGYQLTYRNLVEFCGRKRPTFDSLGVQFFEDFVKFLEINKDYKISSIRTQIKHLRAIINKAYIKKVHSNIDHKGFKIGDAVKTEKIVNVYLTPAELDRIWRCTFKDHLKTKDRDRLFSKELEAVRDSFIVGCFTGLRFSDWGKMRNDLIENDIIKITSQKTGEEAEIPVHRYVKAVLKKYNGKMPKQLNNDKTNDLIKIICQSAFIRRMTAIPHTKGGVKLNPEPVEKWNLCHSHTARRSLCTNLINQGCPVSIVMRISGHRSLEAFEKYILSDSKDMIEILKKLPLFQ